MKKMRVAYLRVSTDEQAEQQTIETQRTEFILPYCKSHGITLDRFYEDNGVSSRIPVENRPAGRELLKDAEAGLIGEVYIWKVSRLARNLRMFLNLVEKLDRLGVKMISITEPIPEGHWGRAFLQLHGLFAEIDYATICEHLAAGRRRRAKERGYAGGPANFGYRKIGDQKTGDLEKDTSDTSLLPVAVRMLEDSAAGKSDQVIADWMNAMGVPTSRQSRHGAAKTGKLSIWRPTSVGAILKNPIYKGLYRQFDRHRVLAGC